MTVIDGDSIRKKFLKESIDEQRKLFTFCSDGYMCVNKYCLIIDLVFRLSKRMNDLLINDVTFLDTAIVEPDSYYQKLYHVSGYKNIKMKCKDIMHKINYSYDISSYDLAKLYFDYTHFTGCLQNIITSDEFECIWDYVMNMVKRSGEKRNEVNKVSERGEVNEVSERGEVNEVSERGEVNEVSEVRYERPNLKITSMRKLLYSVKCNVMLINSLIGLNLFDDIDALYSKIKLTKVLKYIVGTYYDSYVNETYINDYRDYYICITVDFFDQTLEDTLRKFNKRFGTNLI